MTLFICQRYNDNVSTRGLRVPKYDIIINNINLGRNYKMVGIKPLGDRVVIKKLEAQEKTQGGLILTSNAKEHPQVAEVVAVGPGTKDYGALSLAVQYYADPQIIANVPPNCFMPRPNVGSAVIRLTSHKEPPVQVEDEKLMFKIIRASFNQRRKTLANGLNNSTEIHLPKDVIIDAIEKLGKGASVRGEALTLEEFANLSNIISEML